MNKWVLGTAAVAAISCSAFAQRISGDEVVSSRLSRAISNAGKSSVVKVTVLLKSQPATQFANEMWPVYEPSLKRLSAQMAVLHKMKSPSVSLPPAEEMRWLQGKTFVLDPMEIAILRELDEIIDSVRHNVAARAALETAPDHDAMRAQFARLGGSLSGATSAVNAVFGTLPSRSVWALANDARVLSIDLDMPGSPELDVSGPTLGAASFWGAGATGNPFDCGVLDTGVYQAHPDLSSHRFESNAGTTDSNGHGTAMAGIMAGTHATLRGIAFGLDTICVAIAGADSTSMNGMNYIATGTVEKPENVNYSFGNGRANDTDYGNLDKFFDGVIDTFRYMVSKSTGNGGWGTTTITHPAPAFNLLASANMNDFNTVNRADDRINSSSSRGPTLGGRKKPDITAPGTNINAPNRTGGYTSITGTSPASPHTGASILLLNARGTMDTFATKAILLNNTDAINDANTSSTSDDTWVSGSHWNKTYGWGYLNLSRAFLHATDVFVRSFPAPVSAQRRFKLFKGTMFAGEKATLVWNRHVTFAGAQYPSVVRALSDLNLDCFRQSNNALLMQSASLIDNVEQISVSGTENVVLKTWTRGNFDSAVTSESYALATEENFSEAAGPAFLVQFTEEADFVPGAVVSYRVYVKNTGDVPAHNVQATLHALEIASGPQTVNLGSIPAGESALATWTVRMPRNSGELIVTVTVNSNSYGETFTGLGRSSVGVG
ncbi:MAG: hypothetical protein AMXMBFR19_14470 [Chthonomonadaceae bacterium]|uniref:Serine protease AprX n=1 Tax=Candidatus Nitrosymbiomonas proteolyticus TaxID=2608984 RepID=A0A809SE48_9BACT|nr:serine protease AprX [Candidatus Nitrosymbiomonas proteolyticus]